jgi:carnitine O-acetyltransferase
MSVETPRTFEKQAHLPRLPVPSLEETAARYLRSIQPLVSQEEYKRHEALVFDFISPNGLGRVLQQRLLDVDKIAPYNWLDDTFWRRKAYHEWREPLVVNSNWHLLFIDDPNTPHEYLLAENGISVGYFSTFQIKRAAHLISKLLEFKELLDRLIY